MKKIALFLVLITTLVGCSLDNGDRDTYTYSVLPIETYELPAAFKLGQVYTIKLTYQKPSACHIYQGIYYGKELNKRTIAIQAAVKDNQSCTSEVPPISEASFNFTATATGSYIFKIYKGKGADDKDLFEDVEIPVIQ